MGILIKGGTGVIGSALMRALIDDRLARDEWGWQLAHDLEAMIDDFVTELSQHPDRH